MPSFMLLMLLAGLATMGLSLYKAFGSSRGTPLESTMLVDPYTFIPFLWGLVNTVPPLLYIHYTAVNGSSLGLKWTCSMLRVVAMAAGLGALGLILPPLLATVVFLAPLAAIGLVLVQAVAIGVHMQMRDLKSLPINLTLLLLAFVAAWLGVLTFPLS